MAEIMAVAIFIDMLVVIGMVLYDSVARTKSSLRWMKGICFKEKKSKEEAFEYIRQITHPSVKTIDYNLEGKIVVHTEIYDFPMELSENKEGNTVIGFIVNWAGISKYRRKKVTRLFDELCFFVSCVVEGKDLEIAMNVYEKNRRFSKALLVAGGILVILVVISMITGII